MISFLNNNKAAAVLVFWSLWFAAKVCNVDARILSRAEYLFTRRQVEYPLGFIAWFLRYRLAWRVPEFNIYHLVPDTDKDWYLTLLEGGCDDYRVEKQYYLLQSQTGLGEEFTSRIRHRLKTTIRSPQNSSTVKDRTMDTDRALDSLFRVDRALRAAGIKPFLVSGTLLGAIRDKKLIEGDNDLDIGVMAEEATDTRITEILLECSFLRTVYNLGHLVQATDRNGTVVDIFVHYPEKDRVWHGTAVHKWDNTPFGLSEIQLGAQTYYIPDDPDLYLQENYGNWKERTLFFDYAFDTPNHSFLPNRRSLYYLADRIVGELEKPFPSRHIVEAAARKIDDVFDLGLDYPAEPLLAEGNASKTKVVVTFGTFDLFHIGHLNILRRAASYGDNLIVGVSSDALNHSKKGIYPVYSQEDRMDIVRALDFVSEVFLEESLELKREYLSQYDARILIMGDDWQGKFDHLSDCCEVVYLPRTENISTTETKDSIRKNL